MDLKDPARRSREAVSAGQVFGAPIERDGVTVIPAATVLGGGGGGIGETAAEGAASPSTGRGFGFALFGWPAGAFEIREHEVRWHPAVDRTLVLFVGLCCAAAIIRALRSAD